MPQDPLDHARLDKWLWAARFYKTRALAAAAIDGGKVEVNGEKAKRAKPVRPGDALRIRLGPYEYRITVLALATQRGPAAVAAGLYREDPAGQDIRERIREQHRLAARVAGGTERGRPTKRDRREIGRLKGRE
ncbi:MAG TPA: S4 domain-containing protein [Gemmatimonadales bacterium]|nr:S4 domain-containing protein [Gemmatimonadales bacterium]